MKLARRSLLRFGDLTVEGASVAGDHSWFRVQPPGLAFDVGRGPLRLTGARDLFISHGHLDHCLGLPFLLSHRTLHHLQASRVFCPREVVGAVRSFIEAAAELEGVGYRYELTGLAPGDRVEAGRDLTVEAFRTDHVVPSLGYHLLRSRRQLATELRGRSSTELADLRRRGVEIETVTEALELSYCGDTGPGVFELEPRLYGARILLVECTFVGEKLREKGRRFGHMHLDDLAVRRHRFDNQELVLHHLSRRHRVEEVRAEARRALAGLKPRLHVLPEPREDSAEAG